MNVAVYLSTIIFVLWSPHPAASLNTKLNATNIKYFISSMSNLTGAVLGLQNQLNAKQPGPSDCTDVRKSGNTKSGVYRIWPVKWEFYGSFLVFCDMEKYGGAWTVIQRRGDYKQPKDYFYRTWKEYQMGFGNLREDFWLGDSFSGVNGMAFSTKDSDNDIWHENCAKSFKGGWWYSNCHHANLNGLYLNGIHNSYADGIEWDSWKGLNYSLSEVDMKIRRIQVKSHIKNG